MKNKKNKKQSGQIIIIGLVFFAILVLLSGALVKYISSFTVRERQNLIRTQALHLAEAGIDNAVYKLNREFGYSGESNTPLGDGTFSVSIEGIDARHARVTSTGFVSSNGKTATRTIKATIGISDTIISFRYGVQVGNGGFTMANSSTITGNVFSNGTVVGSGDNYIYGDVVAAGPGGRVYGIHSTGSVFSHVVGKSDQPTIIDKDAYYTSITNTTVSGNTYPGSPDQAPVPMPISDEQISEWENDAAAGGTISTCDASGNYEIGANTILGPKKIDCNLIVKNVTLTIAGPLWVTGNITIRTNANLEMDPGLGSLNVAVIADKPSDRSGSGTIQIEQGSTFEGSEESGSFVFLISQNNSAESGGSTVAISQSQGAAALVAYASHGLVTMNQSANVKSVTAYKIALAQSANVTYDSGLPSTLFESGPGASWVYIPGTYVIER